MKNKVTATEADYMFQIRVNGNPVGAKIHNQRHARMILEWMQGAITQIEVAVIAREIKEMSESDMRDP